MKKMNKKGFTIVELVIVIAVIAILAAVLIPTFSGVVNKANYSAAEQSARNAITAGIQMTSNAVLPEGTKIFVDSDKNGTPDYVFNYNGNGMESATLYGDDGSTVVSTILNSATKATDGAYIKFNNVLVSGDYVTTAYGLTTDSAIDATKTYYTKTTENNVETYTKVAEPVVGSISSYYVAYDKLDTVIESDLKVLVGGTANVTYNFDANTVTVADTQTITLNVYTSTDMPVNSFVLVYLK